MKAVGVIRCGFKKQKVLLLTSKRPGKNIPKAILAQYIIGFFSALLYLIAMFYGINDLTAVLESPYLFPLTEIYRQATGTVAGALGRTFPSSPTRILDVDQCAEPPAFSSYRRLDSQPPRNNGLFHHILSHFLDLGPRQRRSLPCFLLPYPSYTP